jgi:malonyl-CoA decarboxylase
VALVPEMAPAIAPLIDKRSSPLPPEAYKVAVFYSISNCQPGLRGVSLGNFLIKRVADQLKTELPQLKTFCTLSPIPGFAAWLKAGPDFTTLPDIGRAAATRLQAARQALLDAAGGELDAWQARAIHEHPAAATDDALQALGAAWLAHASTRPDGDPVARFHLDNGARLERLNLRADLSPKGLRQSCGMMVNYLYDLDRIESSHAKFRRGTVARSRAVAALI